MPELSSQFLLQQLSLTSEHCVVLALSGGLDSMVLLHLLSQARAEQPFELQAVYINHGISQHAQDWAAFCARQCAVRNVRFSQRKVELAGRDNLEFKARTARYGALAEFVSSAQHLLLTAHHADDQFESLLLAIKRGAGVTGMGGIKAVRPFAAGHLQRPLLGVSRQQLQQYALAQQLSWVEDDSNSDQRFERNFIRKQITPLLTERWPHFIRSVGRSMDNMQQLEQLLQEYSDADLQRCVVNGNLCLAELRQFSVVRQNYIIRRWLKQWQLNPSSQWLDILHSDVIAAREDASPMLQLEQYQLRRFAQQLHLLSEQRCRPSLQQLIWQGEAEIVLADQCGRLLFSAEPGDNALPLGAGNTEIVFGQLNLRFKPYGAAHSKPLKQWFKLWQVAPWQRARTPLLLVDGQLQLVAGYGSAVAAEQASYWVSWHC